MSTEVRRIVLESTVAPSVWAWRDAVSGERATATFDRDDLEPGDELVVELTWRARWEVTRYLELPPRLMAVDLAALRIGSHVPDPTDEAPAVEDAWTPPRPGEIRVTRHAMDARSTAHRDAGKEAKHRPVLVVWADDATHQAGVRLLFGSNSRVRRDGLGRRIRDWQAAGLRKASYVSSEEVVCSYADLSRASGSLSPEDRARLL